MALKCNFDKPSLFIFFTQMIRYWLVSQINREKNPFLWPSQINVEVTKDRYTLAAQSSTLPIILDKRKNQLINLLLSYS